MKLEYVKQHISDKLKEVSSPAGKRILEHRDEILNELVQANIGPKEITEDVELLLDVYIVSEVLYLDIAREKAKLFGYSEFAQFIASICETYSIKEQDDFYSRIYSVLRSDVTYEDYVAKNLFEEDIENLYGCLSGTDNDASASDEIGTNNKELRYAIASKYHEIIQKSLNTIKERYRYLTGSIFGIKTYAGVLVDADGYCACIKEGKAAQLQPADELKTDYLPYIFSKLFFNGSVQVKKDRQFNYTEIVKASKNSSEPPFYYPYKILELVSKCGVLQQDDYTFTKKTKALNYTKIPSGTVGNHENYLKHIVSYFESSIIDYIFTSLYIECLVNDDFKTLDATGKENYLVQQVKENSKTYLQAVKESLYFFVNSVTTAVVISDLTCMEVPLGEGMYDTKVNSIKFMLCVPEAGINNETYVTNLAQNKGLVLDDLKNLESSLYNSSDETYQMVDLKYVVNEKLAQGLPDFAYKALAELTKQGVALNWQNILLGNSIKDDLVTSKPHGDISLQDNRVHWIFAGSRSGKGVMCYNIFTTAMASGLPIFYMDRKPDTSAAMREIAPNMFAVNGGQYDDTIDYKGTFAASSVYNTFKNIPPYLKHISTEDLADYAYMRGILLTFALLCFADKCKSTELGQELTKAITSPIIVIDEFSNYFHSFLGPKFHQKGWFNSILSDKKTVEKFKNYVVGIEKAKNKANKSSEKSNGKASESTNEASNVELINAMEDKPNMTDLYMSAVVKGYLKVLSDFQNAINAGGNLIPNMHVFIIGQNLDEILAGCGTFASSFATGDNKMFKVSDGICPLISCLDSFSSDFILGANMPKTAIMQAPKFEAYVNLKKLFFAYKKGAKLKTELSNIVTKGDDKGYTPFKPFLILNNAVQPPKNLLSVDIAPSKEGRRELRKGVHNVEARPSQFVGQCLCNVEEAGLGWKDLLGANPSENDPAVLHDGVGLLGYVERMAQANSVPLSDIVDKLNKSGELMTKFVQKVYGYPGTWEEFIYDMDPKWIITTEGLVNGQEYIPVEKRLSTSFLLPGIVACHPERYLKDELATISHLYNGQAESTTVNTDNINFDAEFVKQTKEEPSSSEASNTTSGSFNTDNTAPNNQSTTFSTNNTAQSGGNGLTLEAIRQTILSYAAKAKLPPNQWGTFTNAVVRALGLMEV